MKALNVLLSILVCVVLFLLCFEGGLRLLGKGPNSKINQPDATVGWVKRPDFSFHRKTDEFDVVLRTNSLGLRDDEMESAAKPAGQGRVLCLGDSFVLGYTVDRDHLFVDQLERWWRAEGRALDVVNTGTEGWSTDQEVAWFEEHGADYAPDLVLLFVYENDFWWNGQDNYLGTPKARYTPDGQRDGGPLPIATGLGASTAIGRLFKPSPKPAYVEAPGGGRVLADFAVLLDQPPAEMQNALARTQGALKALKRQCADLSAKLVVVPIPSHSAIEPSYAEETFAKYMGGASWSADRPVELTLAYCQELGIEALDPRPALKGAAGDEPLYYQTDFHLTPAGNEALASYVKHALDPLGVVPGNATTTVAELAPPPPVEAPAPLWPKVFGVLWVALGAGYVATYRGKENAVLAILKVGLLLAAIFAIVIGGKGLLALLSPKIAQFLMVLFVLGILGFVVYKLGRRTGTILELLGAFVKRGHWYLMPLVVVLLTIGSLLVVAASSPLVAPFIYTLF